MMRVVAFDTSTQVLSVALTDGTIQWNHEQERVGGVEGLLPLIQKGCQEVGWQPNELQGVICGAGPGSFTGLRTGIATAKGLCVALEIPLVLVSSYEAWALQATATSYALVCSFANQAEVYACLYRPREHLSEATSPLESVEIPERLLQPNVWRIEELQAAFPTKIPQLEIFGDAPVRVPFLREVGMWHEKSNPKASDLLRLGLPRLLQRETEDVERVVPVYLLMPPVEKKKGTL